MDALIYNTTENAKKFHKDYNDFIAAFAVISAAVCIGLATKDMVTEVMTEVVLPVITLIVEKSLSYSVYQTLVRHTPNMFWELVVTKVAKTVWIVVIWMLVIFVTYLAFKVLMRVDIMSSKINAIRNIQHEVENTDMHQFVTSESKQWKPPIDVLPKPYKEYPTGFI